MRNLFSPSSRKSVQQAKPAFHLVESVSKLASNKYHVPVTVTTVASTVSETSPKVLLISNSPSSLLERALKPIWRRLVHANSEKIFLQVVVRICDLMGGALGKMDVMVESAMRVSDGVTVLAKTQMTEGTEAGLYEIDMFKANPGKKTVIRHSEKIFCSYHK